MTDSRLRAFLVELALAIVALLLGICVLAHQQAELVHRLDRQQLQLDQVQCEQAGQNRTIYGLPEVTLDPSSRAAGARDVCAGLP